MEILFKLLFELFGEYILAFLFEAIGSLFSSITQRGSASSVARSASTGPEEASASVKRGLGWPARLIAGTILGALSLYVFPHSFAKSFDTQLAVLIGVPIACGLSMGAIGALKRKRHQEAAAIDSFRNGFLFALPFVAMRFFFTV